MRTAINLIFFASFMFIPGMGCKKDKKQNSNSSIILDSINTYIYPTYYTPAGYPYKDLFAVKVELMYGQQQRISNIKQTVLNLNSITTYSFFYNSTGQLSEITSTNNLYPLYKDSILVNYPSPGKKEVAMYIVGIDGTLIPTRHIINMDETQYKVTITVVEEFFIGNNPTSEEVLKAVLNKDANENISEADYYIPAAGPYADVLMEKLTNEYHLTLQNPYYQISQQLGIPFFSMIDLGHTKDNEHTDLIESLSKSCISSVYYLTYDPSVVSYLKQWSYSSDLFVSENNVVKQINIKTWKDARITLWGVINANATFYYK